MRFGEIRGSRLEACARYCLTPRSRGLAPASRVQPLMSNVRPCNLHHGTHLLESQSPYLAQAGYYNRRGGCDRLLVPQRRLRLRCASLDMQQFSRPRCRIGVIRSRLRRPLHRLGSSARTAHPCATPFGDNTRTSWQGSGSCSLNACCAARRSRRVAFGRRASSRLAVVAWRVRRVRVMSSGRRLVAPTCPHEARPNLAVKRTSNSGLRPLSVAPYL